MPAKSNAQQRLMAAAAHGAQFPMARRVRASMTAAQLHDFASGSMKHKPSYAEHVRGRTSGKPATAAGHPHKNLGKYLHPKKRG